MHEGESISINQKKVKVTNKDKITSIAKTSSNILLTLLTLLITIGGVLISIGTIQVLLNPDENLPSIPENPNEKLPRDIRETIENALAKQKKEVRQRAEIEVLENKTLAQIFESRIPGKSFDEEAFLQLKEELITKSTNILSSYEQSIFGEIIDDEVDKWWKERQEAETKESTEESLNKKVNNSNISLKPKLKNFVLVPFITGVLVTLSASLIKTAVTLIRISYKSS